MSDLGPIYIFIAAFLWSTDALFRQPLTGQIGSTTIVLLEHLFGLGILLPLLIGKLRELKNLFWKDWLAVLAVGVGGSAIATILFTSAFQYVGPSVAILLQKTQPLFAILLAVGLLGERLRPKFWAWAAIAIAAAFVISFPNLHVTWSLYDRGTRGVLYALIAALLWGSSTVFGRYAIKKVSYPTMSALRFIVAVLTVTTIMGFQGTLGTVTGITSTAFFRILAIVLISGTTPILLYYKGLKTTRASVSTIVELVFPFSAVILNWIFLNDKLVWQQIAAGIVLLIAIIRIQSLNSDTKAARQPALNPIGPATVE